MHFDYITAAVNVLDYLEVSFKHNRCEFDRFTVVTTPEDEKTHKFCRDNGIGVITTRAFYRPGAKFDRGFALNYAFAYLQSKNDGRLDWVIHADADVFPPAAWRGKLNNLDKEWFYGARRVLLKTRNDYLDLIEKRKQDTDYEIPLGYGYGFWQMFNWNSSVIRNTLIENGELWYPPSPSGDATQSDWMFRNKWGEHLDHDYTRSKGRLAELPFYVYHIGEHGKNHQGRTTQEFK